MVFIIAEVAPQSDTAIFWVLLIVCGVVAVGAFLGLFLLTRQSSVQAKNDVQRRLAYLRSLVIQTRARIAKLDSLVIDRLRTLSVGGEQSFNVLKQTVDVMEARVVEIDELLASGEAEKLFRAQAILSLPIENTGDHVSSVLFSETVLTLQPDQFEMGINAMLAAVEKDISEPRSDEGGPIVREVPRRRRFTIRGFLKSISGPE